MLVNPHLQPGTIVATFVGDFEDDQHEVLGKVLANDGRLPIVQWDDCAAPLAAPFCTFDLPEPSLYDRAMAQEHAR